MASLIESTVAVDLGGTCPLPIKPKAAIKRRKAWKLNKKCWGLLNLAAGLDGCDDQMLPASFRAMETELGFYPSILGWITLVQTLALSVSCPMWGYLSDRKNRKWVLTAGCCSWGIATLCLSCVHQLWQVMLFRGVNGFFMASIGPVSQSLLSDLSPSSAQGFLFGCVQTTSNLGRLVGGVVTTMIGSQIYLGATGWRWCVGTCGILSITLALCIATFLPDIPRRIGVDVLDEAVTPPSPPQIGKTPEIQGDTGGADLISLPSDESPTPRSPEAVARYVQPERSFQQFWGDLGIDTLTRPSVILMFLEGMVGLIPWSAMSFLTMFYQYCDIPDVHAGFVTGALLFGAMVAGPVGGLVGDKLSQLYPHHGRVCLAQCAILFRMPLLYVLFNVVQQVRSSTPVFLALSLLLGLSCVAGTAVNRPVLTEVVVPEHRATVFALVIATEGAIGALLGAPLVGILSENVFGYQRISQPISAMSELQRSGNAYALSRSLIVLTMIPWTGSFLVYTCLHLFYSDDKNKIAEICRGRVVEDPVRSQSIVQSDMGGQELPHGSSSRSQRRRSITDRDDALASRSSIHSPAGLPVGGSTS